MPATYDQLMAWIRAAQAGDTQAMETITQQNVGLVRAAMKRFSGMGGTQEDLYQAGCLGLVEAIRRFDVSRGVQFSTYAVPYILGEMKRFLRTDHTVHVPRTLQDQARAAWRMAERLRETLGREPTITEIAREMGVEAGELAAALSSREAVVSLDAPAGSRGTPTEDMPNLGDVLGDAGQQVPFERVLVRGMLEECAPGERVLLGLRFFRGLSQAETARAMGVSQPHVSRLEKRILSRLRALETG